MLADKSCATLLRVGDIQASLDAVQPVLETVETMIDASEILSQMAEQGSGWAIHDDCSPIGLGALSRL